MLSHVAGLCWVSLISFVDWLADKEPLGQIFLA